MDLFIGGGSGTYAGDAWPPDEIAKKIVSELKLKPGDTVSKNQICDYLEQLGFAPTWASDVAMVLRNMFDVTPIFYESYAGTNIINEMRAIFDGGKSFSLTENDWAAFYTMAVVEATEPEQDIDQAIIAALSMESLEDIIAITELSDIITTTQMEQVANIFLEGRGDLLDTWLEAVDRPHMIRFMNEDKISQLTEVLSCDVEMLSEIMSPSASGVAPAKRRMFKSMAKQSNQKPDPLAGGQTAMQRLHNMRINAANKAGATGPFDHKAATKGIRDVSNRIKGQAKQFKSGGSKIPLPPDYHGGSGEQHGPSAPEKSNAPGERFNAPSQQVNHPLRQGRLARGAAALGRVAGHVGNFLNKAGSAAKKAHGAAASGFGSVKHGFSQTYKPDTSGFNKKSHAASPVQSQAGSNEPYRSTHANEPVHGIDHGDENEHDGGHDYGHPSLASRVVHGALKGAGSLVGKVASSAKQHINNFTQGNAERNIRTQHVKRALFRMNNPTKAYIKYGAPSEHELHAAQHMGLHHDYKTRFGIEAGGYDKNIHSMPRIKRQSQARPRPPEHMAEPHEEPQHQSSSGEAPANPSRRRMGQPRPRRAGAI
jgi:hypothetical protein